MSPTKQTFEGVDLIREGLAPKHQCIKGETREAEEDNNTQDKSKLNIVGYPTTSTKGPSKVLKTKETKHRRKAANKKH